MLLPQRIHNLSHSWTLIQRNTHSHRKITPFQWIIHRFQNDFIPKRQFFRFSHRFSDSRLQTGKFNTPSRDFTDFHDCRHENPHFHRFGRGRVGYRSPMARGLTGRAISRDWQHGSPKNIFFKNNLKNTR